MVVQLRSLKRVINRNFRVISAIMNRKLSRDLQNLASGTKERLRAMQREVKQRHPAFNHTLREIAK